MVNDQLMAAAQMMSYCPYITAQGRIHFLINDDMEARSREITQMRTQVVMLAAKWNHFCMAVPFTLENHLQDGFISILFFHFSKNIHLPDVESRQVRPPQKPMHKVKLLQDTDYEQQCDGQDRPTSGQAAGRIPGLLG